MEGEMHYNKHKQVTTCAIQTVVGAVGLTNVDNSKCK